MQSREQILSKSSGQDSAPGKGLSWRRGSEDALWSLTLLALKVGSTRDLSPPLIVDVTIRLENFVFFQRYNRHCESYRVNKGSEMCHAGQPGHRTLQLPKG